MQRHESPSKAKEGKKKTEIFAQLNAAKAKDNSTSVLSSPKKSGEEEEAS